MHFDHNFNKCVLFFENIQRITHQRLFVSTHHKDKWGMAERYMLKLFKFGNDAHPMQQMFCIHFFKRLGPKKNIFWSYGRGGQGKAFYSLQPFSCPFLVRPLVKACHFIASYNFPMSFQNLSTYPLSDPNSWLENHLQDPPPKRNQDPGRTIQWPSRVLGVTGQSPGRSCQ